jgi:hypothetical protein
MQTHVPRSTHPHPAVREHLHLQPLSVQQPACADIPQPDPLPRGDGRGRASRERHACAHFTLPQRLWYTEGRALRLLDRAQSETGRCSCATRCKRSVGAERTRCASGVGSSSVRLCGRFVLHCQMTQSPRPSTPGRVITHRSRVRMESKQRPAAGTESRARERRGGG